MKDGSKLLAFALLAAILVPGVAAQGLHTEFVPHHVTGLKQIGPESAAVYCAAVGSDAEARRETHLINRLAQEVLGDDAAGVSVPLENVDAFVAPRAVSGKQGHGATFDVSYSGFSPEAKTAFQYAVDVWSALIESPVPIKVRASWRSLNFGVLGSAGPEILHADFGYGELDKWYASALANAMAGEDLSTEYVDIVANFNSDYGSWYFGLDGNTPPGMIDFVTVVMHEIGHGLGFFGTMRVDNGSGSKECDGTNGSGCWGFEQYPEIADIFEAFAEDGAGTSLIDTLSYVNPSEALGSALRSRDVHFNGPATVALYGARAPLYAPSSWSGGSSFSHVDENTFRPGNNSSLMTPFVSASEAIHDPGVVGCGIFADMGWQTSASCGVGAVPEVPSIPVPLTPANGAVDVPVDVTITWQESVQADAYDLQVARTASFSSTVISESGLTAAQFTATSLEEDTQYFWRVRATNDQYESQYSTTFSFTTASAAPAAPLLASPEDGAEDLETTVTLEWQSAENADTYALELDTTPGFDNPVVTATTSDTTHGLTDLQHEESYFWRVRGLNGDSPGEWSETWSFTTVIDVPDIPTLTAPEKGATSVPVDAELAWGSVPRADEYEVQLAEDPTFETIVVDSVLADLGISLSQLANKTSYFWRVRGLNRTGAGEWSAISQFQTIVAAPVAPTLTSPANDAARLPVEVTLSWDEVVDASSYEIEVAASPGFETILQHIEDIATTSVVITGLNYDTEYFWRVRAVNVGGESDYSSPRRFVTQIAPPFNVARPVTPVDRASSVSTDLVIAWKGVAGAEAYRLQLSIHPNLAKDIVMDTTITSTSINLDDLAFETAYYWRLRAVNSGGDGPWSSIFGFTTGMAPPEAGPIVLSPADSTSELDRTVALTWDAVATAQSYELIVARDSVFADSVVVRSGLTETASTAEHLEYETTYFWRVRAVNAGGPGPWSPTQQFTTRKRPSGVATEDPNIPDRITLHQNYPNPFNPTTTFEFVLPSSEHVHLEVIDLTGRTVAVVVDKTMAAGRHSVAWSATDLPSGTYVYRLRAGTAMETNTLVLLK